MHRLRLLLLRLSFRRATVPRVCGILVALIVLCSTPVRSDADTVILHPAYIPGTFTIPDFTIHYVKVSAAAPVAQRILARYFEKKREIAEQVAVSESASGADVALD